MGKGWAIGALVLSGALSVGLLLSVRTEVLTGRTLQPDECHLVVDLERTPPWAGYFTSASPPVALPGGVRTSKSGEVAILLLQVPGIVPSAPEGGFVVITHREVRLPATSWALGGTRLESGGRTYPCGRAMGHFYGWLAVVAAGPMLLWCVVSALATLFLPRRRPAANWKPGAAN